MTLPTIGSFPACWSVDASVESFSSDTAVIGRGLVSAGLMIWAIASMKNL